MMRRSLVLLVPLPLFACASTKEEPAPPLEDLELYTYRVAVPEVPAEVSQMVLTVETIDPRLWSPRSVHGLVGNAPFDVQLSGDDIPNPCSFSNEQVSLSYSETCRVIYTTWKLQLTTRGKPVELGLRFAYPKGAANVGEIESALVKCTTVTGDGHPIEAAATRLERVR